MAPLLLTSASPAKPSPPSYVATEDDVQLEGPVGLDQIRVRATAGVVLRIGGDCLYDAARCLEATLCGLTVPTFAFAETCR
jgi:hypothetical protein